MRQSKLNLKARQSGHLPKFAAVAILLLAGIPAISRAQQPGQKTFASAEGLSWTDSSGRSFVKSLAELQEWLAERAQAGRQPPNGFPRGNNFG